MSDITPLGSWVVEEVTSLAEMMAAERRLFEVIDWFPDGGYDFHIARLADAAITRVQRADATAPISRIAAQFSVGGPIRAFSLAITGETLSACWRNVMDGTTTWDWVFTDPILEILTTSPTMARRSRELLKTGRAEHRHFHGDIPHVVVISDACVDLGLADEDGAPTALLQSDDETVRSWADRTFEAYWAEGGPLDAEVFTA